MVSSIKKIAPILCSILIVGTSIPMQETTSVPTLAPGHYSINSFTDPLVGQIQELCHITALNHPILITCDVDHTLIMHAGTWARYLDQCIAGSGSKRIKSRNQNRSSQSLHYRGYSALWLTTARTPIEGDITVQALRAFCSIPNTRVLGLTHIEVGQLARIDDLPAWRSQQLAALGITFGPLLAEDFVRKVNAALKRSFADKSVNTFPILYGNMLCTNKQIGQDSKGRVLEVYLNMLPDDQRPTFVVSFDDCPQDLRSIEAACHRCGIPVYLFEYRGSEHHAVPSRSDFCSMAKRITSVFASCIGL